MATSSQVAPATTAAVGDRRSTSTTSGTIAGLHDFRIDNFSATKDLGVGKSIKSSTFRIGGHGWYIECYPCGVNKDSKDSVSFYLCRQDDLSRVWAECIFTVIESLNGDVVEKTITDPDGHSRWGTDLIKREELERLLESDCLHVRCTVYVWIDKFPAVPQRDLATETVAGSHVLRIEEYSKTRQVLAHGDSIDSFSFRVGGHWWFIQLCPCGEDKNHDDGVTTYLCLDDLGANKEQVMVRFEMTLLTHAGQIISSIQNFHTFTDKKYYYPCYFLGAMEHELSPLFQDSIHVSCDMAIVSGITATPNLRRCISGDLQGSQQVKGDVTFEVSGHLFAAHKCVLATRCAAFMAEFFGPSRKDNADVTDHMRINDMEPRVFEALFHFIYTDALPEVSEEEKVVMAQSLLVAADRYGMERLKLICSDMLCSYVNDAGTALATLELASKHGCRRLMEACIKLLKGHFAKVAP